MSAPTELYLTSSMVADLVRMAAEQQALCFRLLLDMHLRRPRGFAPVPEGLAEPLPDWLQQAENGELVCPHLTTPEDSGEVRQRAGAAMEFPCIRDRSLPGYAGWLPTSRFASIGQVGVPNDALVRTWHVQHGTAMVCATLAEIYEEFCQRPSMRPRANELRAYVETRLSHAAADTYGLRDIRAQWLDEESSGGGEKLSG